MGGLRILTHPVMDSLPKAAPNLPCPSEILIFRGRGCVRAKCEEKTKVLGGGKGISQGRETPAALQLLQEETKGRERMGQNHGIG